MTKTIKLEVELTVTYPDCEGKPDAGYSELGTVTKCVVNGEEKEVSDNGRDGHEAQVACGPDEDPYIVVIGFCYE